MYTYTFFARQERCIKDRDRLSWPRRATRTLFQRPRDQIQSERGGGLSHPPGLGAYEPHVGLARHWEREREREREREEAVFADSRQSLPACVVVVSSLPCFSETTELERLFFQCSLEVLKFIGCFLVFFAVAFETFHVRALYYHFNNLRFKTSHSYCVFEPCSYLFVSISILKRRLSERLLDHPMTWAREASLASQWW